MDELWIEGGGAARPLAVTHELCAGLPESARVADVSALAPGRAGAAVRLSALVERAGPRSGARFLNVASADPAFAVSLPLEEVLARGLVVYELGGAALPASKGGPFRLLVPGHADECVHVKQVTRIEISDRPGRDTRPADDAEHAKLHARRK